MNADCLHEVLMLRTFVALFFPFGVVSRIFCIVLHCVLMTHFKKRRTFLLHVQINRLISKTLQSYTNHYLFIPVQDLEWFSWEINTKLIWEIGFWNFPYMNVLKSDPKSLKIAKIDIISIFVAQFGLARSKTSLMSFCNHSDIVEVI